MITVTKEIELNGKELAEQFWSLDAEEQASFFNNNLFKSNGVNAIFQLDWLVDNLNEDGIEFIEKLYSSIKSIELQKKECN